MNSIGEKGVQKMLLISVEEYLDKSSCAVERAALYSGLRFICSIFEFPIRLAKAEYSVDGVGGCQGFLRSQRKRRSQEELAKNYCCDWWQCAGIRPTVSVDLHSKIVALLALATLLGVKHVEIDLKFICLPRQALALSVTSISFIVCMKSGNVLIRTSV